MTRSVRGDFWRNFEPAPINVNSRYQFKVEVEVREENGEEMKNERL